MLGLSLSVGSDALCPCTCLFFKYLFVLDSILRFVDVRA